MVTTMDKTNTSRFFKQVKTDSYTVAHPITKRLTQYKKGQLIESENFLTHRFFDSRPDYFKECTRDGKLARNPGTNLKERITSREVFGYDRNGKLVRKTR